MDNEKLPLHFPPPPPPPPSVRGGFYFKMKSLRPKLPCTETKMVPSPPSSTPVSVLSLSPEEKWSDGGGDLRVRNSSPGVGAVQLPTHGALDHEEGYRAHGICQGLHLDGDPVSVPRARGVANLLQAAKGGAGARLFVFFLGAEGGDNGGMSSMYNTWCACTFGVQQETLHTHE